MRPDRLVRLQPAALLLAGLATTASAQLASSTSTTETYVNFYSSKKLDTPVAVPGFTGMLEIDVTDGLINGSGVNTLFSLIDTNAGNLSFFTLSKVEVDLSPVQPLLDSGVLPDIEIYVQPIGFVDGAPARLGEAGTLRVEAT